MQSPAGKGKIFICGLRSGPHPSTFFFSLSLLSLLLLLFFFYFGATAESNRDREQGVVAKGFFFLDSKKYDNLCFAAREKYI